MASTYSSILRLELVTTGEQAGTWGNTTNTNLGTLIEAALAGTATHNTAGAGDTTLSAINGSADEARAHVLKFTGALTGSHNVICPSVSKTYLVYNATSGAYTVTLKTAAGTGVLIPQGGYTHVYCDGTNVVNVNVEGQVHQATGKTTPVDADEIGIWDSVSLLLNKLTWANLKATLKTYNDGFYALKGANTDITSLNAPALGAATANTQAGSDSSTKVATTAMVHAALPAVASSAEVIAGTDNVKMVTALAVAKVLTTKQATTSGTSIDFSSLPSGIKRITCMFTGVSTNGTSHFLIQIGTGGAPTTSGYLGATCLSGAGGNTLANSTQGFIIFNNGATSVVQGALILTLFEASTNTWTAGGGVGYSDSARISTTNGSGALSGVLNMVRFTTVNGTDAFDAGAVNLMYE